MATKRGNRSVKPQAYVSDRTISDALTTMTNDLPPTARCGAPTAQKRPHQLNRPSPLS